MSPTFAALDRLADDITQVRVVGEVETEEHGRSSASISGTASVSISEVPALRFDSERTAGVEQAQTIRRAGPELHYVHFGALTGGLEALRRTLGSRRIWLLLDEWSALPIELQPLLADLLRRSLFPLTGVVVKITAIEHRSRFTSVRAGGDYLGIELGADVSANVDLDDFLVFGNNADQAQVFFRELLYRHVAAVLDGDGFTGVEPPKDVAAFLAQAFTQSSAFDELVRAAEGVPRDAINVAGLAAQLAGDDRIGVNDVRNAARRWYQRDKESALTANEPAERLLHWIVDQAIGSKRTKGFILNPRGFQDAHIRSLYDARVLHLLRRGISSRDQPGVRFNAFGLDFGCYVHLTAARAPTSLFQVEGDDGLIQVDVPGDDYRSIRTAVLDLDRFYASTGLTAAH